MRKVSDHMRLVKREAGANPARTRHRDSQATAYYHWETGKGVEASERSVGRPAFRSTGTKSSGHEELAVRKNRTDCFL